MTRGTILQPVRRPPIIALSARIATGYHKVPVDRPQKQTYCVRVGKRVSAAPLAFCYAGACLDQPTSQSQPPRIPTETHCTHVTSMFSRWAAAITPPAKPSASSGCAVITSSRFPDHPARFRAFGFIAFVRTTAPSATVRDANVQHHGSRILSAPDDAPKSRELPSPGLRNTYCTIA